MYRPLEGSLEQVLDMFDHLPQNDGSYLGIYSAQDIHCIISKYNKFVWLMEIYPKGKKGVYQIFLTTTKTREVIKELFAGLNPLKINGLSYESNPK